MKSLGFIETRGLLAAIEAADAMVKSADVSILGREQAGGGLVCITVAGDVSAVQAAIDAGVSAVCRIEGAELVSRNVIARPYDDVAVIIPGPENQNDPSPVPEPPHEELQPAEPVAHAEAAEPETSVESAVQPVATYTISELKKATVIKLRQIASELSTISLSPQEIRRATKKKLIEAILNTQAS